MSTELKLSSAPHAHGLLSTGSIMKILVASLIPAIALNVYYYGCGILINIVIACLSCTLSEALILKIRHKNPKLVFIDFSAIVTGVLIALTIPQLTPWYLTVAGSLFAMIIVKHCYGGLGQNIFNPAMAGFVFLLITDLATALRTIVVLAFSWIMVLVVGSVNTITTIEPNSLIFLILSGLATGASWICYFKALSVGDINKVVPIDKSSTILTVLLAIVCFGETSNLAVKLIATAILAVGIFLMVEKKQADRKSERRSWMIYAILSAVFAALTSVLAKVGISGVESNLGTAIRTGVVLVMAWIIVFARGKQKEIKYIDKKELLFIALSGIATGASWLCYYYAVQNGVLSVVVPIDKLSILVTVVFSYFVFREKLSKKALVGLCFMVIGTLLMAFFK